MMGLYIYWVGFMPGAVLAYQSCHLISYENHQLDFSCTGHIITYNSGLSLPIVPNDLLVNSHHLSLYIPIERLGEFCTLFDLLSSSLSVLHTFTVHVRRR